MIPPRPRLVAVLVLAAATLFLFGFFDRYQVVQPQLLSNGGFSGGLSAWRAAGGADQLQLDQGVLQIRSKRAGQSPGIRQVVERNPDIKRVCLSAWLRHTAVGAGPRSWNGTRILLVQRNSRGDRLWELPHQVDQSRGDGPWRRVSETFWLPAQVSSVEVTAVLNQVVGEMQVRGLTLEAVREHAAFTMARYALTAAWLLTLPWLIWPLYQPGPMRRRRLSVILMGAVILVGVLTPQTAKIQLRKTASAMLQSDVVAAFKAVHVKTKAATSSPSKAPPTAAATPIAAANSLPAYQIWFAAAKLGHVIFFALLAVAVTLIWRRQNWRLLCLYLTAFAVAAETLQLLSLDRNATPVDAGLNLLGTAAGLGVGLYAIRVTKSLRLQT